MLLLQNFQHDRLVTFCRGYKKPRDFKCTSFFPKWESLRGSEKLFVNGDQKLECKLEDIQNENGIDLPFYLDHEIPFRELLNKKPLHIGTIFVNILLNLLFQFIFRRTQS